MQIRILSSNFVIIVLVALMFGVFGVTLNAAPTAGRTSADFLQIGVGADAAGMGGAYSSVARGASAAFWNPARIVSSGSSEVTLSHFMWYQGIKLDHGAAAIILSPTVALGASFTYLNYGSMDGYDINGNLTGEISSYDMQGGLSLSFSLNENLSVGVTGKYVGERLADLTASTFAGDIGISYQSTRWSVSAAAVNLSKGITFATEKEQLPSAVRIAVAATPFSQRILTSLEIEKRLYGDVVLRNGMELNFGEQYFLRAGYNYYPQNLERKFGSGFSVGGGVRLGRMGVDYAFTPSDSYISDDLHRFTLVMSFGN